MLANVLHSTQIFRAVDGQNPAPPKKPWNNNCLTNANKRYGCPWFPSSAKWISSIHGIISQVAPGKECEVYVPTEIWRSNAPSSRKEIWPLRQLRPHLGGEANKNLARSMWLKSKEPGFPRFCLWSHFPKARFPVSGPGF